MTPHEMKLLWGQSPIQPPAGQVTGEFLERDGETWYRIANYDRMPPFFMTVVSGYDHWMFISSAGGLTCGRRSPAAALFPYDTDDKIHHADATTGPQTVFQVRRGQAWSLWQPFDRGPPVYRVERNLYKNRTGNRLTFEECNHDLGVTFSYCWSPGDRFGFIRQSTLHNFGDAEVTVELLDGLRNLLPAGVDEALQAGRSTLVDAYKQAEAVPGLAAAIYTLSSIPSDRAEPSEALRATLVWCRGLVRPDILLSEEQVAAFSTGLPVRSETASKGRRGAFYVHASLVLPPEGREDWCIVSDVEQGPAAVPARLGDIRNGVSAAMLRADIDAGTRRLMRFTCSADGCQKSSDRLLAARHFSNTLFNVMRGGAFYDGYRFPVGDFLAFVGYRNAEARAKFTGALEAEGAELSMAELLEVAGHVGDPDLQRLAAEYLPLTFSRRHGDPSRPWNRFSIDIRNPDGSDRLGYEGNWRDIFQNWEALSGSHPEFIESFITRFVNASTRDGYNPYRVSSEGFEWEVLDPADPWSNIGYWGDHQVNYLAPLLELSRRYHPGRLAGLLSSEQFVFADVPYRLKSYPELIADPRNSVRYDAGRAGAVEQRIAQVGGDGRLLTREDGSILRVNLLEKLLLPALVKLGSFVPGGGIWMNTQRPDWNDANNALVGHGLSMVTLCYLRRYLAILLELLQEGGHARYEVSQALGTYFDDLATALRKHRSLLDRTVDPGLRKTFMDELGSLAEGYRARVYADAEDRKCVLATTELAAVIRLALDFLDHTIGQGRRDDGLYSAYRLLHFGPEGYAVEDLDEMLEGQVAVMNSGYLDPTQCLALLNTLRESRLYRADRDSYLLYPDRELPRYLRKNLIPPDRLTELDWVRADLDAGCTRFVERDVEGDAHFNPQFRNVTELRKALAGHPEISEADGQALCDVYEDVFAHRRFTGRSGTMYKYEGLGCIYWHMVSKLALAAADAAIAAARTGQAELSAQLFERFAAIRDGLGVHSSPEAYGAFPIDPYSHSPVFGGVQQPGMTGQVKEDFICRFRELGVQVRDGQVHFEPVLLRREEFLSAPARWHYLVGGRPQHRELSAGALGFTLCSVPVVYRLADAARIEVHTAGGEMEALAGSALGREWSRSLFERRKTIDWIAVEVPEDWLR